ncbi:hypothetical protein OBBRIDRAFT_887624 [Obba rivulosa]|uniref:Uncharacterized protein n=1 Tax=Obba rivulosa TaxID=1052685 RepID=A0A8E2AT54_9APHY|nr:hypothetical protein OBBRIDRAFT_887624 [Obba rivulosa]
MSSTIGAAARRSISPPINARGIAYGRMSVFSAFLRLPTRTPSSSCGSRYLGPRQSSTVAPDSETGGKATYAEEFARLAPELDPGQSNSKAVDSASVPEDQTTPPAELPSKYLTLIRVRKSKKVKLSWRTTSEPAADEVILMSNVELKEAAAMFVDLIDNTSFTKPRPEDAQELLNAIDQERGTQNLRKLVRHRALHHLAEYLVKEHPLHALHAMSLARYLARNHTLKWEDITGPLAKYRHWDFIPTLVDLQLQYDGIVEVDTLNLLVKSYITRGLHQDRNKIMQMFEEAGAEPNEQTETLLAHLENLSSPEPVLAASGSTQLLTHRIPVTSRIPSPSSILLSIIRDVPTTPRKSHAPELVDLIRTSSHSDKLLPLFTDIKRATGLAGRLITEGHPLHALHVVNIAYQQMNEPGHDIFARVSQILTRFSHWEWIPALLDLQLELTGGQTTTSMLNWYGQSFIERSIPKDPEEFRQMFQRAGLKPTHYTRQLLTSFTLRYPGDASAIAQVVPLQGSAEPSTLISGLHMSAQELIKTLDQHLQLLDNLARELIAKDANWAGLKPRLDELKAFRACTRVEVNPTNQPGEHSGPSKTSTTTAEDDH